jgi:hypothetical protein
MLTIGMLRSVPAWWIWFAVEVSGGEKFGCLEAFLFHILNVATRTVQILAQRHLFRIRILESVPDPD